MANGNPKDQKGKIPIVLAPKDNILLSLLITQFLVAVIIFGGALEIMINTRSDVRIPSLYRRSIIVGDNHHEHLNQLYPRRRGGGGGGSGNIELTWVFVTYYSVIFSAVFLLYNAGMMVQYFRKKMQLGTAIWWGLSWDILAIFGAVITGLWAKREGFEIIKAVPSMQAVFWGHVLLSVIMTISIPQAWMLRSRVLKGQKMAPAPIQPGDTPDMPGHSHGGTYTPMVSTSGPTGQFHYQQQSSGGNEQMSLQPSGQQWGFHDQQQQTQSVYAQQQVYPQNNSYNVNYNYQQHQTVASDPISTPTNYSYNNTQAGYSAYPPPPPAQQGGHETGYKY